MSFSKFKNAKVLSKNEQKSIAGGTTGKECSGCFKSSPFLCQGVLEYSAKCNCYFCLAIPGRE